MGWVVYSRLRSPTGRDEERAELIRLFVPSSREGEPFVASLAAMSKVGTVWYMAVKVDPRPGETLPADMMTDYVRARDGSITYGLIVLTSRAGGEWGYKDMDEGMGPVQATAPLAFLDALSDLVHAPQRYAADWRARVRAYHAARKALPRFRPGDRVATETVLEFGEDPLIGQPIRAARFEAFVHKPSRGRRGQTLYKTLDTQVPYTVRITAAQMAQAGARKVA